MQTKKHTLILGGQARLPKEISTGQVFQVVVELDPEENRVIRASFAPCPSVIEDFLKQMIIGVNLETQLNDVLVAVEQRLQLRSKKAVLTAIKDLDRAYREYRYGSPRSQNERLDVFKW